MNYFFVLVALATILFMQTASIPTLASKLKAESTRGTFLGEYEFDSSENRTELSMEDHDSDVSDHEGLDDTQSEEDLGDSDVSEERNEEDFIDRPKDLKKIHPEEKRPDEVISMIDSSFNNKKTFSCPKIKSDLLTGTSVGDLSPEDIGIVASMGDALATGATLWPNTDIEFRGAAFTIGGDATIDGLITIPNILREFNPSLLGVSHGMGTRDQLPPHQLSVGVTGSATKDMPEQARELVKRLKLLRDVDYRQEWVLISITIGTEEVCSSCGSPDLAALIEAVDILSVGVPKALIVLLGPIHVSSAYKQKANLLKSRCSCSNNQSEEFMTALSRDWTDSFLKVQDYVEEEMQFKRPTFGLLALPMLTITSRYPYSLFTPNTPLLNRRGHNYATKWLWNRLMTGEKYNLSSVVLSKDAYFCPSVGCPYFRTPANMRRCMLLSLSEAEDTKLTLGGHGRVFKKPRRTKKKLYTIAVTVVLVALCVVCTCGTIFYQKSKQGRHGRFDVVDEAQKKFEEAVVKEEEKALIRANTLHTTD